MSVAQPLRHAGRHPGALRRAGALWRLPMGVLLCGLVGWWAGRALIGIYKCIGAHTERLWVLAHRLSKKLRSALVSEVLPPCPCGRRCGCAGAGASGCDGIGGGLGIPICGRAGAGAGGESTGLELDCRPAAGEPRPECPDEMRCILLPCATERGGGGGGMSTLAGRVWDDVDEERLGAADVRRRPLGPAGGGGGNAGLELGAWLGRCGSSESDPEKRPGSSSGGALKWSDAPLLCGGASWRCAAPNPDAARGESK
mgnify:CR=1 FL=1